MPTLVENKTLDALNYSESPQDAITNGDPQYANEDTFPEGGRSAWFSLLGCFCAWMCAFGLMNVRSLPIVATP